LIDTIKKQVESGNGKWAIKEGEQNEIRSLP